MLLEIMKVQLFGFKGRRTDKNYESDLKMLLHSEPPITAE